MSEIAAKAIIIMILCWCLVCVATGGAFAPCLGFALYEIAVFLIWAFIYGANL